MVLKRVMRGVVVGAMWAAGASAWADQPMKFVFGSGKAEGYAQVTPTTAYSKETGFGFDQNAKVTVSEQGGSDPLQSGAVTGEAPFFFSVKVPEGNYKVTVTLGDAKQESTTTVKAELRRLMLENVHTDAGKFETKSFIVNVRTPAISNGQKVKLKGTRESVDESFAWDEKLTLEFNGTRPAVDAISVEPVTVPTVFLLGDSTVCDQGKEPYASWGQMLTRFMTVDVAVANHGESGETVGSSNGAKRFDKIMDAMKPGDFLLVQFGHNDMKEKAKDPNAPQKYMAARRAAVGAANRRIMSPKRRADGSAASRAAMRRA